MNKLLLPLTVTALFLALSGSAVAIEHTDLSQVRTDAPVKAINTLESKAIDEKRPIDAPRAADVETTRTDVQRATDARSTREERGEAVDARQVDRIEKGTTRGEGRAELQAEREGKRDERVAEREAKKEERKTKILEKRIARIEAYLVRTIARLDAAVDRIATLSDRVLSRIVKFEERGIDMSEARRLLAQVGPAIDEARTAILDLDAEQITDILTTSENPKTAFEEIREEIRQTVGAIKLAHKTLVDTIRVIKAVAPAPEVAEDEEDDESSTDTDQNE